MIGTYKIADRVIEIRSLYPDVHDYCRKYRACGSEEPGDSVRSGPGDLIRDFIVTVTEDDIEYERTRDAETALKEGRGAVHTPDGRLEIPAVYRKIAEKMIDYDTFLFHGSCVAVDGKGYLFTAPSGTGKSTHARLWREYLGERAVMVNDDKPLIRADGKELVIYGTPYSGKHRLDSNISVPLKAVCLIGRAEENRVTPITKGQAYPFLLQQTYRPADSALMIKTLELLDRLADGVNLYRLECNTDISAAETAVKIIK